MGCVGESSRSAGSCRSPPRPTTWPSPDHRLREGAETSSSRPRSSGCSTRTAASMGPTSSGGSCAAKASRSGEIAWPASWPTWGSWGSPGKDQAHHLPTTSGERPGGSGRPGLQCIRAESAVGGRHHLRVDLVQGFCYVAFIIDVYSRMHRRLASREVSEPSSPSTPSRWPSGAAAARIDGLVHHSDRGGQGEFNRALPVSVGTG